MKKEVPARHEVIMAGVGGRGVLMVGLLLAQAAMAKYPNVLWFPSYASAMRGGPCECTVVFSNDGIASPILPQAQAVIIMETSQVKPFEGRVRPGGLMVVESTGLPQKVERQDITVLYIPGIEKAIALGNVQVANFFLFGAYLETTRVIDSGAIDEALEKRMSGRGREQLLALNKQVLREGMKLAREAA